jgi:hypothetical protein
MLIHSAVITGSVQFNNTDVSGITNVSSFATTASVDAVIVKTGSFATTSSVNELQSKTGSYASTSSVNELQSKTGSYTSTSSFDAYSSSINTFTSSATTRLNTIESVTGSYASTSSVNNLQSVTGSYASTGSNQFNGNQSISGSITSNGTITAQTLVVQTVTSSVEFVTGSTRNGSIAGNTHQFTGSVLMSGSHTVNGGIVTTGASAGYSINRRDTSVYAGGWYAPSSSILLDVSGFGTALTITSAGNVGIGTTLPDVRLHISGSDGIKIQATGNSDTPSLTIINNTNQYGWARFGGGLQGNGKGYAAISCWNASTIGEVVRISGDGNVGIGTTSPSAQIHIIGNSSSELTSGIKLTRSEQAGQYIVMNYESGIANFTAIDTAFSGPQFRFNTSTNGTTSTERVRITKDGYITLPYQPAFYAYYTAGAGTATTGAFTGFNSTRVNRGSHYNTSNGRFTAPIAGVYEFIFSALWRQGTAVNAGEISIGLNGANINARGMGYINFGVGNNGHAQISVKAILSLSANDYVTAWIHVAGTSSSDWYYGENLGYFCGTLIG